MRNIALALVTLVIIVALATWLIVMQQEAEQASLRKVAIDAHPDDQLSWSITDAEEQGAFGADLAFRHGFRRLVVLQDNDPLSTTFSTALNNQFQSKGGLMVEPVVFEKGTDNLDSSMQQLNAILAEEVDTTGPDGIYIVTDSTPSAIAAINSIRNSGRTEQLFSTAHFKNPAVYQSAGQAAQYMFIVDSDFNIFKVKNGTLELRQE